MKILLIYLSEDPRGFQISLASLMLRFAILSFIIEYTIKPLGS
jgi:hypothetical protein